MRYVRAAALFGALGFSIFAAGCSGSGGATPPISVPGSTGSGNPLALDPTSSAPSTQSLTATQSTTWAPSSAFEVNGLIDGVVSSTKFEVKSATAGEIYVYTSSTTQTWGRPAKGSYAIATGSGSGSTSEQAHFLMVLPSAPQQLSVTGTVTSTQPYGVAVKLDSNGSYIPVAFSSQTRATGSIAPGAHVSVSGIGSIKGLAAVSISSGTQVSTTTSTATPAPYVMSATVSSGVPRHLLTADYFMGAYGTHSVSPGAAAPYLTWAQTSIQDSGAIAAAGIKVQFYTDPIMLDPTLSMDTDLPESAYAHTCTGHRAIEVQDSTDYYLSNMTSSAMQSRWSSYIGTMEGMGHIDMLFEDGAGPLSTYAKYPYGKPCGYTDALWDSGTVTINNTINRPVMVNGANNYSGTTLLSGTLLTLEGNTTAIDIEHCYSDDTPILAGTQWINMENEEIRAANEGKTVECMSRDLYSASSQVKARIWTLASFLLAYKPTTSILAEEFATPSGLHVMPESQLVALDPVQSQPTSIAGLKTSTGAYGRQYKNCYLKGVSVGPCAVAVTNDYGTTERFPFSGYHHTLSISGNGILDGGTVSAYGSAPPSEMSPYTAVIAFN